MIVLGHSSPVDPFMRMPALHRLTDEFVGLADGRVDGPELALNYTFLVIWSSRTHLSPRDVNPHLLASVPAQPPFDLCLQRRGPRENEDAAVVPAFDVSLLDLKQFKSFPPDLTWPDGVVDAEEEDHVVVGHDIHHLHRPQRNCWFNHVSFKL